MTGVSKGEGLKMTYATKYINNLHTEQEPQLKMVSPEFIRIQELQPRKFFSEQSLLKLQKSIEKHGVLEPLVVRKGNEGDWELIAGERRLRAARNLGLAQIPIRVVEADDNTARELALVENLNREDLNPIEETEGILSILELASGFTRSEVISMLYRFKNFESGASNTGVTKSEQVVIDKFLELGRFSLNSFVVKRLPLLRTLPRELYDAIKSGDLAYSKALAFKRVKDEELRKELLRQAIESKWSRSTINEEIKKALNKADDSDARAAELLESKRHIKILHEIIEHNSLWKDERVEKILGEALHAIKALGYR